MTDVPSAPTPPTDPPAGTPAAKQVVITTATIWRAVAIVLITLATLWGLNQMRSLVMMLAISLFLALALTPGVELSARQTGVAPRRGRRGDLRGRHRGCHRDGRAHRARDRQGRRPDREQRHPVDDQSGRLGVLEARLHIVDKQAYKDGAVTVGEFIKGS